MECRVPLCLGVESFGEEILIVLEDLDAAGFPQRRSRVGAGEIRACLDWLANFHATFLGAQPDGLWQIGTYWHLATRPDELRALSDSALKRAAAAIDRKLNSGNYRTLVHGDAKLANFVFPPTAGKLLRSIFNTSAAVAASKMWPTLSIAV